MVSKIFTDGYTHRIAFLIIIYGYTPQVVSDFVVKIMLGIVCLLRLWHLRTIVRLD